MEFQPDLALGPRDAPGSLWLCRSSGSAGPCWKYGSDVPLDQPVHSALPERQTRLRLQLGRAWPVAQWGNWDVRVSRAMIALPAVPYRERNPRSCTLHRTPRPRGYQGVLLFSSLGSSKSNQAGGWSVARRRQRFNHGQISCPRIVPSGSCPHNGEACYRPDHPRRREMRGWLTLLMARPAWHKMGRQRRHAGVTVPVLTLGNLLFRILFASAPATTPGSGIHGGPIDSSATAPRTGAFRRRSEDSPSRSGSRCCGSCRAKASNQPVPAGWRDTPDGVGQVCTNGTAPVGSKFCFGWACWASFTLSCRWWPVCGPEYGRPG